MEIRRPGEIQICEREARLLTLLFLASTNPISLPLPFTRPPSPPTHQRRRRQAGASADPRYPWSLLSIAQTDRAILFARAMATRSRGFFAIIRPSHDPSAAR